MRRRSLTWLSVVIGAATVFWLGYSAGRVHDIGDLAQRSKDADTDRFSISRAGVFVQFERLGGDGKPFLRTSAGAEMLDLSDWDAESRIIVDGTLFELVRLYPQSSVDYGRYRIAETLNGDGWLLERELSLAEDGTLSVEHSFVARRRIRRVDFALAHTHQYFLGLQVDEASAVATVNALTRDQMAAGVTAAPTHRLTVRADASGPPIRFRRGMTTPYGPAAFIADMSADDPPVDRRVVLGRETVMVEAQPG
jgi:hypothetical protein